MDLFCISDGKKCEDICKYAPPENKWPCVDCDMRCHDRVEPKDKDKMWYSKEEKFLLSIGEAGKIADKVSDLIVFHNRVAENAKKQYV